MAADGAFETVWDALEGSPGAAAAMKLRSDLMIAIEHTVASWGLTQARAAKRLGVSQPRLNDLLRGRIGKFSLDALVGLAARAGVGIRLDVDKPELATSPRDRPVVRLKLARVSERRPKGEPAAR